MTTALILLPVAGALVVWLLPLRPFAVASTAFLIALAEVALWIDTLARFDFSKPGLQLEEQQSWFSDLHVSYHVGFYGFSLWLVGMSVVVLAAATGYAFWAGRERPRAYYGLMLLLTGAIVGVFVAQDLLLFYVFWEAMLVPLYFLVGVWGGAGAAAGDAALRDLHDGRLAADAGFDHRARPLAGHVRPRPLGHERRATGSSSASPRRSP